MEIKSRIVSSAEIEAHPSKSLSAADYVLTDEEETVLLDAGALIGLRRCGLDKSGRKAAEALVRKGLFSVGWRRRYYGRGGKFRAYFLTLRGVGAKKRLNEERGL